VNKASGRVVIGGHDLDTAGAEARMGVGVVPQEFNFGIFEKVYDIVLAQAGYYGIAPEVARPNVEKYLRALGLWEKKDAQARALSGGMKRRLMIARALVHDPHVLILDEPTAGVDLELRLGMYDFLRELNASGVTIILTTHYLEEAESLCRNVAIIDKGVIVKQGSMRELLASMEDEVVSVEVAQNLLEKGGVMNAVSDGGLGVLENPEHQSSVSTLSSQLLSQGAPELQNYLPVITDNTLDLTVSSTHTLDAAIRILQTGGYKIKGIKPKSGRLEEFFLKSTKK
jgi:ABC-2 type transport system ATP-binding protein